MEEYVLEPVQLGPKPLQQKQKPSVPKTKRPLSKIEIALIAASGLLLCGVLFESYVIVRNIVFPSANPNQNQSQNANKSTATSPATKNIIPTDEWDTYNATQSGYFFQFPISWHIIPLDDLKSKLLVTDKSQNVALTISDQQIPYFLNPKSKQSKTTFTVQIAGKSYAVDEVTLDNSSVFVNFEIEIPSKHFILFGSGTPMPFTTANLDAYKTEKPTILKILESIQTLPVPTPTKISTQSAQTASASANH